MRARTIWAVLLSLGCGPSYRFVYEGESAFERCYALDYDANVPPAERRACWSSWLASYTYGAGGERIEYARGRERNADSPPPTNTPQGVVSTATNPGQSLRSSVGFAPPSPTAEAQAAVAATPATAPPPVVNPTGLTNLSANDAMAEPPGEACSTDCRGIWTGSVRACTTRDTACLARADDTYRDCMRTCF